MVLLDCKLHEAQVSPEQTLRHVFGCRWLTGQVTPGALGGGGGDAGREGSHPGHIAVPAVGAWESVSSGTSARLFQTHPRTAPRQAEEAGVLTHQLQLWLARGCPGQRFPGMSGLSHLHWPECILRLRDAGNEAWVGAVGRGPSAGLTGPWGGNRRHLSLQRGPSSFSGLTPVSPCRRFWVPLC